MSCKAKQAARRRKSDKQKRRPTVNGTLRRYQRTCDGRLTGYQRQILFKITSCRTGYYGSRTHFCLPCDAGHVTLHSCGNRHCGRCGDGRRTAWRDRMEEIALDVPYLHNVFTAPHELNRLYDLDEPNLRAMVGLLFEVVGDTLRQVGRRRLGLEQIGAVMTLHTWGKRMRRHVHVHVILAAGGLSDGGSRFTILDLDNAELESLKEELRVTYQTLYLRRLKRRIKDGKIRLPGVDSGDKEAVAAASEKLLAKLSAKRFMIDLQASPKQWSGAEGIVKYLSSYVSGVAISDARVLEDDGHLVTISYKDYRTGEICTETMSGTVFVLRFALHILPAKQRRIRAIGIFAAAGKRQRIEHCRRLIAEARGEVYSSEAVNVTTSRETVIDDIALPAEAERSEAERELFIGEGNTRTTYPATCRHCKRFMTGVFTLDGRMTLWLLPYLTAVMQWLESDVVAPPAPPPRYVPKQLRIFVRAAERGKRKRHTPARCSSKESCRHCRPPPEAAQ